MSDSRFFPAPQSPRTLQSVAHAPRVPISEPRFQPGVAVRRVKPEELHAAALRLVAQEGQDTAAAATRLVHSARAGVVDLSLIFATFEPTPPARDPGEPVVRQACLVVRSSGRTAAVFLSEPVPGADPGGLQRAREEREACVRAAASHAATIPREIRLLQALPLPGDSWCIEPLRNAGFVHVGELLYLRKPLGKVSGGMAVPPPEPSFPPAITVTPLSDIPGTIHSNRALMERLLDETYIKTLDCPALCGLRETKDIFDSHLSVGELDPSLWFLVLEREEPVGCMLLSPCADQRVVELVYIGLVRRARGLGLARRLLDFALRRLPTTGFDFLVCAVDRANTPALALYQRAGFRPFGERSALVFPVPNPLT